MRQIHLFDDEPRVQHNDPCAGRHRGADTSIAAFTNVRKERDIEAVYGVILRAGDYGATLSEICQALGKRPNQLSGRLTTLRESKANGGQERIRIKGKRHNPGGQLERIYVAIAF